MSRFVEAIPFGLKATQAAIQNGSTGTKEYLARVGKYVPGEIIAAYTLLNSLLINFPIKIRFGAFIVCFLLCWGLTPVYFKLLATKKDLPSLNKQKWVSFAAFAFWAYAIDGGNGLFGKPGFDVYYQVVGSALLVVFSLVSGAFIPRK